jgi:hypothetical protein
VDKNPIAGVPGLVAYCVYTDSTAGTVTATATGDNGQLWKASKASQSFSYTRPGGEKSNIGLDGTDTVIGTATFGTEPTSQTILLHVSDAAKCRALYGGDPTTCFVLPGPKPGPICNAVAGNIHPNTFTVPGGITAKIYDAATLTQIATSTITPNIPYRPTAVLDTACPNNPPADPGAAANSRFPNGAGQCVYSKSVPLTFNFDPGTTFTNGQDVVWKVQFNSTHYGYSPIGEQETCFTSDPGCGYDSLNVGAKSYPNAPYAGTDVSDDVAFISWGANSNVLGPDTGWTPYRPLGQIVTGP